jgi:hypothetical protein
VNTAGAGAGAFPLISLLLDLFTTSRHSGQQQDLEILLLRPQLHILQRRYPVTPHLSRWEKLGLAVLAAKFTRIRHGAKTKTTIVMLPDHLLSCGCLSAYYRKTHEPARC